ncbi:MAG: hypothetical protein ACFE9T_10715 [Promethearchaeota archaeon]
MVSFLLLLKKLVLYLKSDIDKGNTPLEIYQLCSCIREAFCLSYSIRKSNLLYLYSQDESILIKFDGEKLRYLGSDERSQALLLKKAIDTAKQSKILNDKAWKKSTPGISVRIFKDNTSFYLFLKSILRKNNFFIIDDDLNSKEEIAISTFNTKSLININESLFIMPTYSISQKNEFFFELFKKLKNIKYVTLLNVKAVEDKILYINFQIDQQINF